LRNSPLLYTERSLLKISERRATWSDKLPQPAGGRPDISGTTDRSLVFLLWGFSITLPHIYSSLEPSPLQPLEALLLRNPLLLYREEPAQDFCAHLDLIQSEYSSTPTTFFLFNSTNLSIPQCTKASLTTKRTPSFSFR
jgi:hypothetical protein